MSICNEIALSKFTFFFFCLRSTSLYFSLSSNPLCCILSTHSCLSTETVFEANPVKLGYKISTHTVCSRWWAEEGGGGPWSAVVGTLFNTSSSLNMEPWLRENMSENNKLPSYHFHWIGIKLPSGGVQHKHTRSDTHILLQASGPGSGDFIPVISLSAQSTVASIKAGRANSSWAKPGTTVTISNEWYSKSQPHIWCVSIM